MKTCKPEIPRHNGIATAELLGILLRAAGVGVAAGIALGGAVLLFSAADGGVVSEAAALHAASLPRF